MYASSAQEAEDWIKILRWKLVSTNLTSFSVLPNFRFVFSVYTEVEEWQKTLAHSSCKMMSGGYNRQGQNKNNAMDHSFEHCAAVLDCRY